MDKMVWNDKNITELCNSVGIEYLGRNEHKRKINIRCKNNNASTINLGDFVKYKICRCEDCGGTINWTKERIIKELTKHGYTYINHYVENKKTVVECYCNNGSYYKIGNVSRFGVDDRRMCGCELCTGHKIWTEESIKYYIESLNYTYIGYKIKDRYEKYISFICDNGSKNTMLISGLMFYGHCSCDKCTGRTTYTKEYIIEQLTKNGYKYLNHYYDKKRHLRVECICPNDNYYNSNWWNFVNEDVRCPCCKTKSKGENKIDSEFKKLGIPFKREQTFPDCKHIHLLRFDFFVYTDITKEKILFVCEYDGIQHTSPQLFGGISMERAEENFEISKIRDNIKNDYCKINDIPLIRVPHTVKLRDIYNYIENELLTIHGINIREFFIATEQQTPQSA